MNLGHERERWRRLIGSDPATEPIPLVSRLRGSPYSPTVTTGVPERVLEALDLTLRVAAMGIRYGAGMREVETLMLATASSLGLADESLEFDLTFTSVYLSYAPENTDPIVRLVVVRTPGRDLSRLSSLHAFVWDLTRGVVPAADARVTLKAIAASRKPYHRTLVRVAWAMMTALVVLRLGGDWLAVATSFVATLLVDRVGQMMSARNTPWTLVTFVGAGLAALVAVAVGSLDLPALGISSSAERTSLIVAGGVMMLLPGLLIVSALEDGLWDYPITASARFFQAILITTAILAGVGLVFALAPTLGADVPERVDPLRNELRAAPWVYVVVSFAATFAAAVGFRVPPRLLLATSTAGALGTVVQLGVQWLQLGFELGVFLAALVIGALSRVWGLKRRAHPLAVLVPAITMLLPGLSVVESVRMVTLGNPDAGWLRLLTAATVAAAIATGSVLGEMLTASVERGTEYMTRMRRRDARVERSTEQLLTRHRRRGLRRGSATDF